MRATKRKNAIKLVFQIKFIENALVFEFRFLLDMNIKFYILAYWWTSYQIRLIILRSTSFTDIHFTFICSKNFIGKIVQLGQFQWLSMVFCACSDVNCNRFRRLCISVADNLDRCQTKARHNTYTPLCILAFFIAFKWNHKIAVNKYKWTICLHYQIIWSKWEKVVKFNGKWCWFQGWFKI